MKKNLWFLLFFILILSISLYIIRKNKPITENFYASGKLQIYNPPNIKKDKDGNFEYDSYSYFKVTNPPIKYYKPLDNVVQAEDENNLYECIPEEINQEETLIYDDSCFDHDDQETCGKTLDPNMFIYKQDEIVITDKDYQNKLLFRPGEQKGKKYYQDTYGKTKPIYGFQSLVPKNDEEIIPGKLCDLSKWSPWSKCENNWDKCSNNYNNDMCKKQKNKYSNMRRRTRYVLNTPKGCHSPTNPLLEQIEPCNSCNWELYPVQKKSDESKSSKEKDDPFSYARENELRNDLYPNNIFEELL